MMNKLLAVLTVLICFVLSANGQSKKARTLMTDGIEGNDPQKIEKALSMGANVGDGLKEAIRMKKQSLANFLVEKGGDPSLGLEWAVIYDNLEMVKLMMDKGGLFKIDAIADIDYAEFIPAGEVTGKPVTYFRGIWKTKDDFNRWLPVRLSPGYRFFYRGKMYLVGNNALIYAIRNNNPDMIRLLIAKGVDPLEPCVVKRSDVGLFQKAASFEGLVTNHYIKPALIMKPIEYAILMGAEKEIVEVLETNEKIVHADFKIDQIIDESFDNNITNVNVKPFGHGMTITFDANVEKIYGVTLLSQKNNSGYSVVNRYPEKNNYESELKSTGNKITFYYSSVFIDDSLPCKLYFKIVPKEYLVDSRNGQKYRTMKIGKMQIMTENFRYKVPGACWAYKNDESNVPRLGYLYNWETANNIAPSGWHLPSEQEWNAVYQYLGSFHEDLNSVTMPGGYSGLDFEWNGYKDSKVGFTGGKINYNTLAALWSSTPDGERAAMHFLLWGIGRPLVCRWGYKASAMGVRFIKD